MGKAAFAQVMMAALLLAPLNMAQAGEVSISAISAASGLPPENPVNWTATPLDLPEDADIFSEMVFTVKPIIAPWVIDLEPGRYQVSGYSDQGVYEAEVTIADNGPASLQVPEVEVRDRASFICKEIDICRYSDPITGLQVTLPSGWAVEQPMLLEDRQISTVFYEEAELGGARSGFDAVDEESESQGTSVWFLNPPEWFEEDDGPCREVSLGALCTFFDGDATQSAFDIIAPSLRQPAAMP